MTTGANDEGQLLERIQYVFEHSWPRPKVIVLLVPAQPDHRVRRARLLPGAGRLRPGQRRHRRARQRLRRAGLRRLAAAVDPAGGGRQGVRRRAVLDDEVVLDGRLADGVPRRQPRGRAGARQAEVVPRLRRLPADPDRRHRHAQRGRRLPPARSARSTRRGATRSATGSTAWAGRCRGPKGTMFAWAPIPEPYREMGSIEFCSMLVKEAHVATVAGRRLRARRRRLRALRAHRERAAHHPGHAQPQEGAHEAGLATG